MARTSVVRGRAVVLGLIALAACSKSTTPGGSGMSSVAPKPDPRVGLKAGMWDAAQAAWNVKLVSTTPPSEKFAGVTNSDLSFLKNYAIQGNYNGFQVWDISNPAKPTLTLGFLCPASQSDVSVYKNLLFVSGEGNSGRVDCGAQGVGDTVSADRLRGIRIFDATDIANPKYIANVQTCRGSHTHTVVVDPKDADNVYIYVSGSAGVRSPNELPGCSKLTPDKDPNSALFRIEVIKVPLAHPEQAKIVTSPRIFQDLSAPPEHGENPVDVAESKKAAADARAKGGYTAEIQGQEYVLPPQFVNPMLDSIAKSHGGTTPNAADSAALRTALPGMIKARFGEPPAPGAVRPGPTQCHDITVYPAIGLGGGACGGYGLLLDIKDTPNPKRIGAVADSNFSYWHSATFNNDGTKILFSDEWGGGGQPKCRTIDKPEWGADAIFTLVDGKMVFQSYYKLPAAQTKFENCVAHNGSLIPIPGRDVMVQAWYQGGISVFDWTDPKHPTEIGFFDRGPVDSTKMGNGGSWSVYWYNGYMVSSEIGRGLDIFELTPSAWISQNEIDAAKSVHLDYFNAQDQPRITWAPSYALSGAYLDQLARSGGLSSSHVADAQKALADSKLLVGGAQKNALLSLSKSVEAEAAGAKDPAKVKTLASSLKDLAALN